MGDKADMFNVLSSGRRRGQVEGGRSVFVR